MLIFSAQEQRMQPLALERGLRLHRAERTPGAGEAQASGEGLQRGQETHQPGN